MDDVIHLPTFILFLFYNIFLLLDYNIYMNQILFNKKRNRKLKYIFSIEFIISVIIAISLIIIIILGNNEEKKLEKMSKIVNKNIELSHIYEAARASEIAPYFGKIYIDKINLEYGVFNGISDELLKVAPCKFYGSNLEERGNICIAGHNYNDNRFFSKLDKLEEQDEIVLVGLDGKEYKYTVFNKFETDENDVSVLYSNKIYELTLITCNNINKKRIIVKAYMKDGDWKKKE